MGDNLEDFFNPRIPLKKYVIKTPKTFSNYRFSEFDEPPPESDPSLICPDPDWRAYIREQERRLIEEGAGSYHGGATSLGSVVNSDMGGIDDRTVATRTIAATEASLDSIVDLRKLHNFENKSESWKLPIIEMKETILDTVMGNQIVILSGPTGCGKSTQVPQYILDQHAMQRRNVNIIVTQPRKIAARSVAERVCQERKWTMGGLVGYQVGLDKAHKSPDTRLLYVTTGILKRVIIAKKNLNDFTHIILDEVHEREEDMDLVMLLCKKLLFTNSRGTKLILMSATLDATKLQYYFASYLPSVGQIPASVVEIAEKKTVNVSVFYIDHLERWMKQRSIDATEIDPDINKPTLFEVNLAVCKMILKLVETLEDREKKDGKGDGEPGSVLVFLPGLHEIQMVRDYLMEEDELSSSNLTWWYIPIHSSISFEEQQKIYTESPPHTRKIILSTNIAESSLTVPDIKYVIDFCLTKNVQCDRETNYPRLVLDWASKNQMIQRKGRAGRVNKDGRVFRLIPEAFYDHQMKQEHVPEMKRIPLTKVVLDVKMLNMGSPKQILALAIDPPDVENLQKSIIGLKEIGALLTTVDGIHVRDDGDLTVMGEIMARLPLDVKLGKLVIFGHMYGVLEEAIIIAAGLNGKSIFTAPFDKKVQAYKNKLYWADRTFSDCFAILLAYQTWARRREVGEFKGKNGFKAEKVFCDSSFLQKKGLMEMRLLVEEITRSLKIIDIEPLQIQSPTTWSGDYKFLILKLVIFGAFYPNYFVKQVSAEVEVNAHRTLLGKDPKTTVYLQGMDENHSKYGPIYAGQIKNLFYDCTKDEEKIKLTFDGRKIFVEFDRLFERDLDKEQGGSNKNMTGEIVHQVHVAVKLRNGRPLAKKLEINLYGTLEDAEIKHKEWKAIVENAQNLQLTSSQIGQVEPPSMDQTLLNIERVTYIVSPGLFWVQTASVAKQEIRLQEIIQQALRNCPPVSNVHDIKAGNLYLAPFKDECGLTQFYRGRINQIRADSVMVFFVDYGNTEDVAMKDLRVISSAVIKDFSELVTIPGLALECSLAGIQPHTLRNAKGLYDDEVLEFFQNLVFNHVGGRINATIFSVTKSGLHHKSFIVNLDNLPLKLAKNQNVDAKQKLIEDKLVDVAVEGYLSQNDHRERMRFTAYNSAMKTHLSNTTYRDRSEPILPSMREDKSKQLIKTTLQGPFSPLEHKILCIYRNGSNKLSNIDPESVNSVMLDQSPSDNFDQWMVSAFVGMSANGEALAVRNTSWLPNKPGLGAMAIMMFAPQVELRVNKDKTKITGFIAGLGPKMLWDKPREKVTKGERTHSYYPEHDIEVKLDVPINNQDVNVINKIRYWMNQMLLKTETGAMNMTQPKHLDAAQNGLKKNLEDLLGKPRRLMDKTGVPCGHEYRWNMINPKMRLKSAIEEQDKFVYKMIDGARILEADFNQAVLEKLISMYSNMDQMDVNQLPYHEICPVCPGQIMLTTPRDLYHHLNTDRHKVEESIVVDGQETIASSSCAGE